MIALLGAVLCILGNAFFVAAEFALARVRPTSLEAGARSGDARAVRALKITERLDAYLTATQFGITLASLGLGWLGKPAVARFIELPLASFQLSPGTVEGIAAAIAFSVISFLHIVIGELVPKSLAILRPDAIARLSSWPMMAFFYTAYPLLAVLNWFSNYVIAKVGLPATPEGESKLSAEELRLIVKASFAAEGSEATKRELLERVLRATDRPARTIMVPRVDMVVLSLAEDLESWMRSVRSAGFSRYPVSEDGDPDGIAGYVYVMDMVLTPRAPRGGVRALKRDVLIVPESCSVGDLLIKFRQSTIPIAIIVDEYGGTSGLATVEDVVEELVGDLNDELDRDQAPCIRNDDGSLTVDGTIALSEIPLDDFQEPTEGSDDTLSGHIIAQLGRLARPGDRVRIGRYEAVVEDMRRRRIGRVLLREASASSPPPPAKLSAEE